MNEEQFQSIIKTANIVKELQHYSVKEDDIINKGYCKYIKLVYSVIHKCLKEFESDISIIDSMYKISCIYDKGEIYFLFNENNLNKIYLTFNDGDSIEILVDLNQTEISFHLIYKDNEYLIVNFKKQEKINDVIYSNKSIKKTKTVLNSLYDIINDVNKQNLQDNCYFLQQFKYSLKKIEDCFET